jgi:hypothetical protein
MFEGKLQLPSESGGHVDPEIMVLLSISLEEYIKHSGARLLRIHEHFDTVFG